MNTTEEILSAILGRLNAMEKCVDLPEYVTIKRAALLTSFSYDFIYSVIQRRELPAIRKGGQWRIAVVDLRAWMEKDREKKILPSRPEMSRLVSRHLPGLVD